MSTVQVLVKIIIYIYDNYDVIWYSLLLYVLMKFYCKVSEDGECAARCSSQVKERIREYTDCRIVHLFVLPEL